MVHDIIVAVAIFWSQWAHEGLSPAPLPREMPWVKPLPSYQDDTCWLWKHTVTGEGCHCEGYIYLQLTATTSTTTTIIYCSYNKINFNICHIIFLKTTLNFLTNNLCVWAPAYVCIMHEQEKCMAICIRLSIIQCEKTTQIRQSVCGGCLTSVSWLRFQRSILPEPSTVVKSAGWMGDQATS